MPAGPRRVFFTFAWDAASRSAGCQRLWRRLFPALSERGQGQLSTPVRRKLPRRAWAATTLSPPPPTAMARSAALAASVPAAGVHRPCRHYETLSGLLSGAAHRRGSGLGTLSPSARRVDPLVSARLRPAPQPRADQLFGRAPPSDRPSPKRDAIRDRACERGCQGQTLEAIRSQLQAARLIGSAKAISFACCTTRAWPPSVGNAAEPNRNRASTPAMVCWCPPWPTCNNGP